MTLEIPTIIAVGTLIWVAMLLAVLALFCMTGNPDEKDDREARHEDGQGTGGVVTADNCCNGQPLEQSGKMRHHTGVVFMTYFTLKSVDLVHVLSLVVSSQHEQSLRTSELDRQESEDSFKRKRTSINEITIEQVWVFF